MILAIIPLSFLLLKTFDDDKGKVLGLTTNSFQTNPSLDIVPDLNISRFLPYVLTTNEIPGTPSEVSVEISGKMVMVVHVGTTM